MSRTTCTYHCGACGRHFHSLVAFDAHRQGSYRSEDPDFGRRCVHPLDLVDKDGTERLAILSDAGECRMYSEVEHGVKVWTDRKALARAAERFPGGAAA